MPKKKVTKKKVRRPKVLKRVKPEHYFIMISGEKIKSLPELALEMDNMADEIFRHHANEARNDFANWIRDVIGEMELADELTGLDKREDVQLQILKHIARSVKKW